MQPKRRTFKTCFVALVALGAVHCNSCVKKITPEEATRTAFGEIEVRSALALELGIAPKSLGCLPKRRGWRNADVDGWGSALRVEFGYSSEGNKGIQVRIESAGPDCQFGTHDDIKAIIEVPSGTSYLSGYSMAEDGWLVENK